MNTQLLDRLTLVSTYQLKDGTSSSYYRISGSTILPNRLSMISGMPNVSKSGRQIHRHAVASLQGKFTAKEDSPYKQYKPYVVRTTLWKSEDYPQFWGWGTIGITGKNGKVTPESDKGDLLVAYSSSDTSTIKIYTIAGMGKNPDTLEEGLAYIASTI